MKKFLISLVAGLFLIPTIVMAEGEEVETKNPVKVYIFEAGGCPACEAQLEYLEGLDSYNEKFEIVRKELYVDHNTWAIGADYDLGVKVAEYFKKAKGLSKVSYTSTPLVVISDLYAANGANTSLEPIINEAYEAGDKDVVECLINNGEECQIPKSTIKIIAIIGVAVAAVVVLGFTASVTIHNDKKELNNKNSKNIPRKTKDNVEEIKEETVKTEKTKKETTAKKTTTKKPATKKTTAKKPTTKKSK